jgi:transcriptional regulator with XRE-family HTH domain
MNTTDRIEKFYKDVEALGLKFPVAEIARKTGQGKGNVSRYLSRKLEPSETFLDAFYNAFKTSYKNVPREIQPPVRQEKESGLDALIQSNKDLAESNKVLAKSHERLVEILAATAGVPSRTDQADAAMFQTVFDLLKQVGKAAGSWKSEGEFQQALSKAGNDNAPGKKLVGRKDKVGT